MPIEHNTFDPFKVNLEQANLIEASAGTGKTYSIAVLALRLVLEIEEITIDKILMVTFTRDATAEMKLRVRQFLRDALQAARGFKNGENNFDGLDKKIVEHINKFHDKDAAIRRLQHALLQFDKASIFTIHGFCSRILGEQAFESGSLFQTKTLAPADFNEYLEDAFNQSWRKEVTILDEHLLQIIYQAGFNQKRVFDLVKDAIGGKIIYLKGWNQGETIRQYLHRTIDKISRLWEPANKPTLSDTEKQDLINNAKEMVPELIGILAKIISEKIEIELQTIKDNEGEATYDDLITGLHDVICTQDAQCQLASKRMKEVLQKRYTAVFIDEFQDTDQHQFEIFQNVFGNSNKHILFYIGDPKQSIYTFRKADLETYFRAAGLVDHIWRMNTNFRSTAGYVHAMNEFFQPVDGFDVFLSPNMKYHKVETPANAKTGYIEYDNKPLNPLRMICCGKKPSVYGKVIKLVKNLLRDPLFKIKMNDNPADDIKAGQIGILIRKKDEGKIIQQRLSQLGIPAVTVSDTKIFKTEEALDMFYILCGVQKIKKQEMHRALLTKVAGISFSDINSMHEDKLAERFRGYDDEWKAKGVYPMLRKFLSDCNAIRRKEEGKLENGDRILANFTQLMEMLHEAETDHTYNQEELISWLKKGIDGERFSEDEYLQRIESDDSSVKIVTMHSCKGLEYDIVIAPFLDMRAINGFNTAQLRKADGYYAADKYSLTDADKDVANKQIEQENLRLLYVAITRARYHCYVPSLYCMKDDKNMQTSLSRIKNEMLKQAKNIHQIKFLGEGEVKPDIIKSGLFELDPPELMMTTNSVGNAVKTIKKIAKLPNISIPDLGWQKTSYSKLNIKQDPLLLTREDVGENDYNQFVFKTMHKGAQSGNFLHDVFEHMDFTAPDSWKYSIRSALNRYPGTGVKLDEHKELMQQLLEHVTGASLPTISGNAFCLNTIPRASRLNELEFDLPLSTIDWKLVPQLVDEEKIPIRINRESTITGGILNGKVDLFFEKDGRYYILDWKSNHLGNRTEDYHASAMATAMEDHNYYLQYYLYCLALYRYLQTRISGFNYEEQFGGVYYLFIRGMRKDQPYGIYFHKPLLADLLMLEKVMLKPSPNIVV